MYKRNRRASYIGSFANQAGAIDELLAARNDITNKVKDNAESAEAVANKTDEIEHKTVKSILLIPNKR